MWRQWRGSVEAVEHECGGGGVVCATHAAGNRNITTMLTIKSSLLGVIKEVEGTAEGPTPDSEMMHKPKPPAREQDMAAVETSPFQQ